jgi:hypothetical protein
MAGRVLHALVLAGVALPDVEPERFLYGSSPAPLLLLADLDGARRGAPEDAGRAHLSLAVALVRRLLPAEIGLPAEIAHPLGRALDESPTLSDLVVALERAALRIPRG